MKQSLEAVLESERAALLAAEERATTAEQAMLRESKKGQEALARVGVVEVAAESLRAKNVRMRVYYCD